MRKEKYLLSHICFEVSTKCNLQCKYCYNIWKAPESESPIDVTFHSAKRTLKKLFKRVDVQNIVFTGGEPLLFKRLSELVLYVRLKGCNVTLITNGNVGSDNDFKMLINLGVQLFELPFHSIDSEIHDYLTGTRGSHKKSKDRIKMIQNLGGRVVAVIVLTKHNISTLKQTILELKNLNVLSIMLNRFNIGGAGISYSENLVPTIEDLRAAYKIANDAVVEYEVKITSNVCTPICILNPKDYPNIWFGHCSPKPENKPLTLDSKGNLRLCNHSPVNAGNIFKNNFHEIFTSEYVKSWDIVKPDFCSNCDVYNICFAGCRAASEQVKQGLNAEDPIIRLFNVKNTSLNK